LTSGLLASVSDLHAIDTFATVYNFEVEKTHTYYVGTEGVLVHNQCGVGALKQVKNALTEAEWATFQDLLINAKATTAERTVFYKELAKLDEAGLKKFFEDFKTKGLDFKLLTIKNLSLIQLFLNAGTYAKKNITSINGFSDNIASILSQRGMSLDNFKLLQQKEYALMTNLERSEIDLIRNSIPIPDGNTILQKVIPKSDIAKYTSGQYTQVGGFVSTAKDTKHLNTFEDIYQGMRLDYENTVFRLSDGSCGVIRYKTTTPNMIIPKEPGKFPYTGNGFTAGNNGRLGVSEWKSPYNTPIEGAELFEVFSDGTEVLRAIFSSSQNKFILKL
jgi:hypothetical protein